LERIDAALEVFDNPIKEPIMSFYLAAIRTTPGDPCAPTEPCIPTEPCAPTDPSINDRLLTTLPRSFSDAFATREETLSMDLWGSADPCTPVDPCIERQPGDPCVDAQPTDPRVGALPGDPCRYTRPLESLGLGRDDDLCMTQLQSFISSRGQRCSCAATR
jgi:hypothetical protein